MLKLRFDRYITGVNFSDFLIKGKEILVRVEMLVRGIRVIRVRVNQVKMAGKWGEIQGKLDSVRVGGEFELSGFYCTYFQTIL